MAMGTICRCCGERMGGNVDALNPNICNACALLEQGLRFTSLRSSQSIAETLSILHPRDEFPDPDMAHVDVEVEFHIAS